ncbi:MAG: LLM class flavin-dependent oxidoreductase [Xenophilus sp.]
MGAANPGLHLNLNLMNAGSHAAAWRWPGHEPASFFDIDYYVDIARLAEHGLFDAIFLADMPAAPGRPERRPFQALEPSLVLTAIARATGHIGLIGTLSSSFNEPYNIARRFSTLDHLSRGRAAINVITSADLASAHNFGLDAVLPHAERYARAEEFVQVLKALWDSWEDDAFVGDAASGLFVDPSRLHAPAHRGRFFSVQGPLNLPRSPQGHPVLVQAGGSADGVRFASRHAEAVFSVAQTLEAAAEYARALRDGARAAERNPATLRIFPGLITILGGTEEEARRREQALWELSDLEHGIRWLSGLLEVDLSALDPDAPLPADLQIPPDGAQTFAREALAKARREGLSLRQLVRLQGAGGTNHRVIVGTPETIADAMHDWYRSGHVHGFNVMPDVFPSGLESFVGEVVPLLQRKGIYRRQYTGRTLREHYGLPRPTTARH